MGRLSGGALARGGRLSPHPLAHLMSVFELSTRSYRREREQVGGH